jgi:hypothetical protein
LLTLIEQAIAALPTDGRTEIEDLTEEESDEVVSCLQRALELVR